MAHGINDTGKVTHRDRKWPLHQQGSNGMKAAISNLTLSLLPQVQHRVSNSHWLTGRSILPPHWSWTMKIAIPAPGHSILVNTGAKRCCGLEELHFLNIKILKSIHNCIYQIKGSCQKWHLHTCVCVAQRARLASCSKSNLIHMLGTG